MSRHQEHRAERRTGTAHRRGFTLVELIMATFAFGIICVMAAQSLEMMQQAARLRRATADQQPVLRRVVQLYAATSPASFPGVSTPQTVVLDSTAVTVSLAANPRALAVPRLQFVTVAQRAAASTALADTLALDMEPYLTGVGAVNRHWGDRRP